MAEDYSLPGWPKKRLVKEVRSHLSHYGFKPVKQAAWRAAWSWASKIANSYFHIHWPMPSEIGTQYVLLLLADMHASLALRLPYEAKEYMPPEVTAMLPVIAQTGFPAVEYNKPRARRKRKPAAIKPDSQQPLFQNCDTT